jgi:hypothetical protein
MDTKQVVTILKVVAGGIVAAAAGLITAEQSGVVLPPWLHAVALSAIGIGSALGIVSNGVSNKPSEPK